ncbi:hypothetical protein [Veillonella caviae]|uniref:hypothetical protein n=1 Tax=Veillonella caviae TaxID=248316 RepID=UPI000F8D5D4F|nr:hypothetical protein [Veillonella caviae]
MTVQEGKYWRKVRTGHSIFKFQDGSYARIVLEDAKVEPKLHELGQQWRRIANHLKNSYGLKVFKCDSTEYYDNIEDDV